jgi:serine/threonine-protein kinase HipA
MKSLEVRLRREPGQERVVGQLAETGPRSSRGKVVFEYDLAFLRDPLWLSPFKLPPQSGLIEHRDLAFGPIFGLFDDSLPDGWGLLLMDRYFQQRGSVLAEVSVLDRLAYLGTRTSAAAGGSDAQGQSVPSASAVRNLASGQTSIPSGVRSSRVPV